MPKAPRVRHSFARSLWLALGGIMLILGLGGLFRSQWYQWWGEANFQLPITTQWAISWDQSDAPAQAWGWQFSLIKKYLPWPPSAPALETFPDWMSGPQALGADEYGWIWVAKVKDWDRATAWLQAWGLAEENGNWSPKNHGEIWELPISQAVVAARRGHWLFLAQQQISAGHWLTHSESLAQSKAWQESLGPLLRRNTVLRAWHRGEALDDSWQGAWQSFFPYGAWTVSAQKAGWRLDTRWKSGNIDTVQRLPKSPLVPKLAKTSGIDPLLFINGKDLGQYYEQTLQRWADLSPSAATFWRGVWHQKLSPFLGTDWESLIENFEQEFAINLHYPSGENPALAGSLVTGIDSAAELDISNLVVQAQQRLTPKINTVTLPNGETRQELVQRRADEILITAIEETDFSQVAMSENLETTALSFGKLADGSLVLGSHPESLLSLQKTLQGGQKNLSENNIFRQAVLFELPASEGYGLVSLRHWIPLISPFISVEDFVWWSPTESFLSDFRYLIGGWRWNDDWWHSSWLLR